MRRAALVALAGALWFATPVSAQQRYDADEQRSCWVSESALDCLKKHFKDYDLLDVVEYRGKFERANWKTDTDCQKVKTALFDLFDKTESAVSGKTAKMYFGLPKDNDAGWLGS
ncbi:MAG: hypothetical protein OXU69_16230 [Gemmatimonadota bacterium]|nr:hypothetical protein [Gemmatimonadota bacterium]